MRRTIWMTVAAVALVLAGEVSGAGAQPASPAAAPVLAGCDVEPRSEEELDRLAVLAATPAAATPDSEIEPPFEGETVGSETMLALERTLAAVEACGADGDIARLLALYTDAFVVREVLAPEPVGIVPGTPGPVAPSGTPEPITGEATLLEARSLPDGRVAALVERGGRTEIVVFAEVGGRWRIAEIRTLSADGGTPPASPDASDAGQAADLPPVRAAIAEAATVAGVDAGEVTVVAVEPVVWPDASLGCPEPGAFYAQVETAGYRVVLEVGGMEMTFHTDAGAGVAACEEGE